jgi:hypothetical protein
MGIIEGHISQVAIRVDAQEEKTVMNFQNEDSIEQRELANQDLIVAKALLNTAEKNQDEKVKKACDKKATENAMEAVEKYQKAVVYADEDYKKISNKTVHDKLVKTHNHKFQQQEQKKAGINILEDEDIDRLTEAIKKRKGEKSPYNAVRFSRQNIVHEQAKNAVAVAEKAKKNLEEMIEDQKHEKIEMDGLIITFDI